MKIVIVGAGKLGRNIIKDLINNDHYIIVIDNDEKVIENIVNDYDVSAFTGNGSTIESLKESGCENADLLIATTPSDELNLFCCMVAKKVNIKSTIARVRNPEYAKDIALLSEDLGISLAVNPDLDTANEIARVLRFPSALKMEKIGKGRVNVMEIVLNDNKDFVDKKISEINALHSRLLIAAVSRNDKIYIPKGDFILKDKDRIYLVGETYDAIKFLKSADLYRSLIKSVLIIGGGKISYHLAKALLESGSNVKIIEKDLKRCEELSDLLKKATIIHGDATDTELLLNEEKDYADAVVTLTEYDEINMIVSSYCNNTDPNGIKVITKIDNPNFNQIATGLRLNSVVSPLAISSDFIVRYVRGMESGRGEEFKTLYRFFDNKLEAMEFFVKYSNKVTDVPIKDLNLKPNILIACIIRENELIIPNGSSTIKAEDTVVIFSTNNVINKVEDIIE